MRRNVFGGIGSDHIAAGLGRLVVRCEQVGGVGLGGVIAR